MVEDGKPWFVLADVCRVLKMTNPTMAAARLDEDEKATLSNTEGRAGSGAQAFTVVSEPGLYSLVAPSRKPEAKAFTRWIRHEVLPALRKHGGYVVGQEKLATGEISREEYLARAVLMSQSAIQEAEGKRAVAATLFQEPPGRRYRTPSDEDAASQRLER